MRETLAVVKVGGSLFDWPELRVRLSTFVHGLSANRIVIVPGGGATAKVVRAWDRIHQLGEEASHWLAIQAMSVNARFLQALMPDASLIFDADVADARLAILDPFPFFQWDDESAGHLPHQWAVTSDSLAVRAAAVLKANELILLKSIDWQGEHWNEVSRAGIVDGYFAEAVRQAPADLRIRVVNLRAEVA